MKNILNELVRNERGQALVMVLGFLVIGGLTIAPLLAYMSTGLSVGRGYKEKVELDYAADAGIEDALWRTNNEEVPLEPGDYETEFNYVLPQNINDKAVVVSIKQIWPLAGLESDENGTTPPSYLLITGGVIDVEAGEYKVQISYEGSQGDLPIDRVAVWLPLGFEYLAGSSSGITTEDPTSTDWRGGKALMWDFDPPVNFVDLPAPEPPGGGFTPGTEYPAIRKLYFNVSLVGKTAGGSYSWVRTTNADLYLAWETGYSIYKISSTANGKNFTVEGYTYFSKGDALGNGGSQTRGDYRAIGNTLELDLEPESWGGPKRDYLLEESNATISDILDDAEVVWAYLYWSAMKEQEKLGEGDYEDMEADREVSFEVNGQQVYFDENGQAALAENSEEIIASKWWLKDNSDVISHTYSYSCFLDVTELVKLGLETTTPDTTNGNGEYTVGGVDGTLYEETSYAGWSLIIAYSSPTEDVHQLYLYDDFLFADQYTTHTFTITGFQAPADAEAAVTCFVGEGDPQYGDFQMSSNDRDYIELNGYPLPDIPDGVNPQDNVWNSLSSGLDGEEIDGVDIDTFDVSFPIIAEGDTWADVELGTGYDVWNLVYIILAFRSEYGGLTPNRVGIISYNYTSGS